MGFFTLKNEYLGGPDGKPAVIIQVTLDGKTKIVKHVLDAKVGADAARLEAIENQIDEATDDKHWVDPLTPLAPCKYDPNKPLGRSALP